SSAASPLALHDALPICAVAERSGRVDISDNQPVGGQNLQGLFDVDGVAEAVGGSVYLADLGQQGLHISAVVIHYQEIIVLHSVRSAEHTSELQSRSDLV